MGASMNRNSWTSPFGLAFLVGSLAALVAGFFTGAGMRGGSELNLASPMLNNMAEPYVDENALVAANREPAAPEPPPTPVQAAPAPEPPPAIDDSAPVTRRSPAAEPDADVDLLPPEPREPPRRRRSAEPPPEEDPGDEPPGF